MRGDLARMQTLIPVEREGPAGGARHAITQLEASLRQTYGMTPNTAVCTKPAMPPTYANTQHGQADDRTGPDTSVYTTVSGVDYYVTERRPTATRTSISA